MGTILLELLKEDITFSHLCEYNTSLANESYMYYVIVIPWSPGDLYIITLNRVARPYI